MIQLLERRVIIKRRVVSKTIIRLHWSCFHFTIQNDHLQVRSHFFCRSEAALHLTIGQMILIRSFNFYFSVTRRRSLILAVFILFFSGCCFYLIYQKIGSFYSTLKMKGKKEGTQSDWTFPLQSLFYYSHSSLVAKEADNWTLIGWISLTLKNNSRTKKIWLSWPRYTGTKRLELTRLKPPSMLDGANDTFQ